MDVKLPNLGEGADSGTVVSILVKPGASVRKGQNIIELETGKAVAPIPAPADGRVERIAVKEGEKLAVGGLILVLTLAEGVAGEAQAGVPPAETKAPPVRDVPSTSRGASAVPPPNAVIVRTEPTDSAAQAALEKVVSENPMAGPYVRRVARDLGIDLRHLAGSGKSGQIMISDLRKYVAALRALALRPVPQPVPEGTAPRREVREAVLSVDFAQWGPVTRKPLTPLRKTIAQRMVESATTLPTVTQFDEADITVLNEIRTRNAPAFEARGARLTVTSFLIQALARVLRKHPLLNASIDGGAGEVVLKDYVHIGLAVDTEAGLLVPVIRDADKKDLVTLSKEIKELAAKARDRKISLPEMQGGTFTVSNQGGIGGAHFTPIINHPEVAILGLGRSALKPVIRDGNVVPRLMLPLALTYDHRLIDGGSAARFTVDLVRAFESVRDEDAKL